MDLAVCLCVCVSVAAPTVVYVWRTAYFFAGADWRAWLVNV